MSSSIFFRFKSQKESQRVQFDGTSISVWEAKREIISLSKLGDGTDFDLAIYNADSNEEYDDDTSLIPRSTTVIARRLPAAKPGQGRAARYVSGRMPVNARNSHRIEQPTPAAVAAPSRPTGAPGQNGTPQTEEERIAAMFAEGASAWKQQKEQMATQVQMPRPGGYRPANAKAAPDHPPPPGYLCYRCGEKGHWIQACPTNNDPSWEGRPRVKRTTGIPKSQLKTIEKPKALTNDGLTDDARQPSGVMVNAEGEYVVAVPDQKSWEQYQTKAQASAEQAQASAAGDRELAERGLQCPIDKRLFVDPVRTPCCGTTYCNECIDNALANSDLVCPSCATADVLIDDVTPDEEMVTKIKAYEEEKKAEGKKVAAAATAAATNAAVAENAKTEQDGKSPARTDGSGELAKAPSPPAAAAETNGERSASPAGSSSSSNNNKRKAAEDLSAEQRIPTGPKAMREAAHPPAAPVPIPPGFDASFVEQMNRLAKSGVMPGLTSPGLDSMPMGNNMGSMQMPNPAMMMNMGMGMNMNMGMMNPAMMMQHMAMNGGGPGGGPNMPNFGMAGMNFGMNGNGNNNNYNNGYGQQNWNGYSNGRPNGAGFNGIPTGPAAYQQQQQQQQQSSHQLEENGEADDDAYMRKPVNPGRHQGRARKPRAADFKEL